MEVRFIVETQYANGDDYCDKVDTVEELVELIRFIDSEDNASLDASDRLLISQLCITTEEV